MAAAGLMLAGCQNAQQGKSLDSISGASKADSLIYYFGEMRGAEYKNAAVQDSTLGTPASKQAYIRGVQAGLNAVKADQEAYNRGLYLGMQMAMNIDQFKKDYDVELSKKVFIDGLAQAIASDSVADASEMQREFYRLMNEFQKEKETRDNEAASAALTADASKKGYSKVTDVLYAKLGASDAPKLKDGDKVDIDLKIKTADGKDINAPLPSKLTVGQRIQGPLNDALLALSSGQKGEFLTTAQALFGQRCQQLDLKPADVLTIELTPTLAKEEEKAEK